MTHLTLKKDGRYNRKNQQERLIYMGTKRYPGDLRTWHQFALVDKPDTCWCEVLDSDLPCFEETAASEQEPTDSMGIPLSCGKPLCAPGAHHPTDIDWVRDQAARQHKEFCAALEAKQDHTEQPLAMVSTGRDLHTQLLSAAQELLRAEKEPGKWGCVGPSAFDIAWGHFTSIASHVCTGIDSPPVQRQPVTSELDRALCESHATNAEDEYFKARPQLDTQATRKIFCAGHRRAWTGRDAVIENANGIKGAA